MRKLFQNMFNTCNCSFCQIYPFVSSYLDCVRHFDWTLHGSRVTSLCISTFKSLFNQEFFLGFCKHTAKCFQYLQKFFFLFLLFSIWSQLSMWDKNISPGWWMTSPVQCKRSTLAPKLYRSMIPVKNVMGVMISTWA